MKHGPSAVNKFPSIHGSRNLVYAFKISRITIQKSFLSNRFHLTHIPTHYFITSWENRVFLITVSVRTTWSYSFSYHYHYPLFFLEQVGVTKRDYRQHSTFHYNTSTNLVLKFRDNGVSKLLCHSSWTLSFVWLKHSPQNSTNTTVRRLVLSKCAEKVEVESKEKPIWKT